MLETTGHLILPLIERKNKMNSVNAIHEIHISESFFDNSNRVIYVMKSFDSFRNAAKFYVGITGTPNRTGTSSPLKRLVRHLFPVGKTHSIVRNYPDFSENGLSFYFCTINDNGEEIMRAAEDWLILIFTANNCRILNTDIPQRKPVISRELEDQLTKLYNKATQ